MNRSYHFLFPSELSWNNFAEKARYATVKTAFGDTIDWYEQFQTNVCYDRLFRAAAGFRGGVVPALPGSEARVRCWTCFLPRISRSCCLSMRKWAVANETLGCRGVCRVFCSECCFGLGFRPLELSRLCFASGGDPGRIGKLE